MNVLLSKPECCTLFLYERLFICTFQLYLTSICSNCTAVLCVPQLIAVYEEQEAQQSPGTRSILNGQTSPEPYDSELACFQPIKGGEIEVNSSALKSSMYPREKMSTVCKKGGNISVLELWSNISTSELIVSKIIDCHQERWYYMP